MIGPIAKPPLTPGAGMLCKEQSHMGYVTNNLERALEVLSARYGISEYSFLDGHFPAGGTNRIAFAWAGGQMYEVICASGPGTEYYTNALPTDEFAIRFHHSGFVIYDDAAWQQLEREIAEGRWKVVHSSLSGRFVNAYYIEAPELGHHLEYIRPFQPGLDFFAAIPAN